MKNTVLFQSTKLVLESAKNGSFQGKSYWHVQNRLRNSESNCLHQTNISKDISPYFRMIFSDLTKIRCNFVLQNRHEGTQVVFHEKKSFPRCLNYSDFPQKRNIFLNWHRFGEHFDTIMVLLVKVKFSSYSVQLNEMSKNVSLYISFVCFC